MQSIAEQMSLLYCYIYVFFIVLDIRIIENDKDEHTRYLSVFKSSFRE